jgi:hypothetical protein
MNSSRYQARTLELARTLLAGFLLMPKYERDALSGCYKPRAENM